jgi:hypothetical protein
MNAPFAAQRRSAIAVVGRGVLYFELEEGCAGSSRGWRSGPRVRTDRPALT